jgi:hypothetical protein
LLKTKPRPNSARSAFSNQTPHGHPRHLARQNDTARAESEQLMTQYSIAFDGQHYVFGHYRYGRLADAVDFARANPPVSMPT